VSLTRSRSRVRSPPLISSSLSLPLSLSFLRPNFFRSFYTLDHQCFDCQPIDGSRRLSTRVRTARLDPTRLDPTRLIETGSIQLPFADGKCRVLALGSGSGFGLQVRAPGPGSGFWVQAPGSGSGFWVRAPGPGSGFRVRAPGPGSGLRVRAPGSGFRVRAPGPGSGLRVRAPGSGFRVLGSSPDRRRVTVCDWCLLMGSCRVCDVIR
jgi:hypothetical protein